ncbi:LPS-assembly lipoprotein LptE [Striga asiatica]|uniref:LPS-assembly lipoprotein LptE n=1 Tax=Striga asiatica TaxID=4170 RepID=A0A5A7PJU2_STRAF|nr:LPS-assembly lipoprotein LptE [Striga asiatica]
MATSLEPVNCCPFTRRQGIPKLSAKTCPTIRNRRPITRSSSTRTKINITGHLSHIYPMITNWAPHMARYQFSKLLDHITTKLLKQNCKEATSEFHLKQITFWKESEVQNLRKDGLAQIYYALGKTMIHTSEVIIIPPGIIFESQDEYSNFSHPVADELEDMKPICIPKSYRIC